MNAGIISVGNELLMGFTLDSNSTWIARKLLDLGIKVDLKLTIADNEGEILEAFKTLSSRCDVILCTGGLGPTSDDVTKSAYCDFIQAGLELNEDYLEELKKKFEDRQLVMSDSNREQAMVPDKGETIPNSLGSALGLKYVNEENHIYVMPGVPSEMKRMMDETVLPELEQLPRDELHVTTIRLTGIMESALYDQVKDLLNDNVVKVAFLPGFLGVDVRLMSRDKDSLLELSGQFFDRLGNYVYAEDWETLEDAVGRLLIERGLTLATAESCTGGLLGNRITNVAGSSEYYLGGIVSYSDAAKMNLLGVSQETLKEFGAVSEETAQEMAAGARRVLQSDVGVSITGIAGPTGGTEDKPVGLVYIAVDVAGDVAVRKFVFSEDRRYNKELSAQAALNLVRMSMG
ncbi:MAG TPA: competence/damage-inducible protein A [Candidatus Marinimicrobia bacterium]|nr:competence/damage-inducible protein A [Candidatus Neomarinimicrobiota bacterium]HIA85872.1 competence/damage-inducible protein A [Candidatus Neomarinimicrobiota bacterium]